MGFENFKMEVPHQAESLEKTKDRLFDEYMKQHVLEDFISDLEDYFEEDEIDVFREELASVPEEVFVSVISLPKELREKNFEKLFKESESGKPLRSVIVDFISRLARYNFTIGYHTSPHEILPGDDGAWQIEGTEADHRDDDRMMAYYSTQYRHLYKKRHPKFIYAVRSSFADDSHKTDGNWHRADALSVITKVPFEQVVQYVESTAREKEKNAQ